MDPECCQEFKEVRPCTIDLQGPNEAAPVQGILLLPSIKEVQEEGVMVYSGKILGEIQLHDGHPRPSSGPEPTENLMEVDTGA